MVEWMLSPAEGNFKRFYGGKAARIEWVDIKQNDCGQIGNSDQCANKVSIKQTLGNSIINESETYNNH